MKFKVKPLLTPKPDGILSLGEKDGGIVLRLKVGDSADIAIVIFEDNGQVHIRQDRMNEFGLQTRIYEGDRKP